MDWCAFGTKSNLLSISSVIEPKRGRSSNLREIEKGSMDQATKTAMAQAKDVHIRSGDVQLEGDLSIPDGAHGVVLFAHGSGSSRHSPRNQFVARTIREAGVGTLLFDLLTKEEEAVDRHTAQLRFDIGLLATGLID